MDTLDQLPVPTDQTEGWRPDPLNPDSVRYWDGSVWTERTGKATTIATSTATEEALSPKSPEVRKAALAKRIQYLVNVDMCRVESQSDYQAVLVSGKKVNHVLHLILTLLTFGLWVFVWIGLVIFGGEKRRMVSVDEYGQVLG